MGNYFSSCFCLFVCCIAIIFASCARGDKGMTGDKIGSQFIVVFSICLFFSFLFFLKRLYIFECKCTKWMCQAHLLIICPTVNRVLECKLNVSWRLPRRDNRLICSNSTPHLANSHPALPIRSGNPAAAMSGAINVIPSHIISCPSFVRSPSLHYIYFRYIKSFLTCHIFLLSIKCHKGVSAFY